MFGVCRVYSGTLDGAQRAELQGLLVQKLGLAHQRARKQDGRKHTEEMGVMVVGPKAFTANSSFLGPPRHILEPSSALDSSHVYRHKFHGFRTG